jgi:Ca-activated chloride channel family protein
LQRAAVEVVVKVAAAALVLLAASASPLAQGVQPVPALPSSSAVFKSAAALVALNVTVQDQSARYVAGLQPADFAIYEDGVRQDVRFFESAAVPMDLIVLIDTSSSMSDKVKIVQDAAAGFLKTLRNDDRGAVVGFADSVAILQPLTSDRAQLEQAVRSTAARGSTALNNAVYVALKQFGQGARAGGAVRRQAIVVLSDGADTTSILSLDDVLALARKSGVNVYTVALQSPQVVPGRKAFSDSDYAMKALARETGALSFFPQPADLKAVYRSIANELASQYSIGYVPANGRSDGRFRRIVVQVVTRPELRPRTRPGYLADGFAAPAMVTGAGGG